MHKKMSIPSHVGIIMDGNRRWARKHRLPLLVGHKRGFDRARAIIEYAFTKGIQYLTLFTFSSENWSRPKKEVAYLMKLAQQVFTRYPRELHKRGLALKVVGDREKLPSGVRAAIEAGERLTAGRAKHTLIIAFNYGGREEILSAIREMLKHSRREDELTESSFARYLQTSNVPDPDLIIRTSGEERLSGFLLWKSAYSELYFTDTLWPDFKPKDFDNALAEYARRQRRFGH